MKTPPLNTLIVFFAFQYETKVGIKDNLLNLKNS